MCPNPISLPFRSYLALLLQKLSTMLFAGLGNRGYSAVPFNSTSTGIMRSKNAVHGKSAGCNNRVTAAKVTLPVLLSMGIGEVQNSRRGYYENIKFASSSARAQVRGKQTVPGPISAGVTSHQQRWMTSDEADSAYSDSSYYDSDNSFDMRLLAHRKQRKRMRYQPIDERIQYLYSDIKFFCNPRRKTKAFVA